jgi:hypothetical protein
VKFQLFPVAGIIILGIQFNMIWSEFPKDRLEKICGFDQTTCAFGPFFLVCLGKIYFSLCVHHLISCVRCEILFYTKWCEFQRNRLEKVWIFQPKYCVFELVLLVYLEKIYSSTCDGLLVGIVFSWWVLEICRISSQLFIATCFPECLQ